MRPLLLSLEGFTAFKEASQVNFEGLDMAVLIGPNGAGKSSLLEAMLFALFGKAPRMRGKQSRDFISHGRSQMRVALQFESEGNVYRVQRRYPRKGQPQVRMEVRKNGGWHTLTDKVEETDRAIQGILRIGYDTFTKAVVLPQNLFDLFLKGDRETRRAVLEEILSLGLYEKVASLAGEKSRLLRDRNRQIEERLSDLSSAASPENFERIQLALEASRLEIERLKERKKSLDASVLDLEKTVAHLRKHEALSREGELLLKDEPHWKSVEEDLSRLRGLLPLLPDLAVCAERKGRLGDLHGKLEEARLIERRLAEETSQAGEALSRLMEAREQEEPPLRKRLEGLLVLRDSVQQLDALCRDMDKSRKEAAASQKALGDLHEKLARLRQDREALRNQREELGKARKALENNEERLQIFTRFQPQLSELSALCVKEKECALRLEERTREAVRIPDLLERCRKEKAALALRLHEWEEASRQTGMRRLVHEIRTQLQVGQACPVCGSSVTRIPESPPDAGVPPPGDPGEIRRAIERLSRQEGQLEGTEARLAAEIHDLEKTLEETREKKDDLESSLSGLLGYSREDLLPRGRAEYKNLLASQEKLKTLRVEEGDLQTRLQELEGFLERLERERGDEERRKAGVDARVLGLSGQVAALEDKLKDHGLSVREASTVDSLVEKIRGELDSWQSRLQEADRKGAELQERLKLSREGTERLKSQTQAESKELEKLKARLLDLLTPLGYRSLEELPSINPSDFHEKEKGLETFRARLFSLQNQIEEIRKELGHPPPLSAEVEARLKGLRSEAALTDERLGNLRAEMGRAAQQLIDLERSREIHQKLEAQQQANRKEEALYQTLQQDLQKNRLPDFLQSTVLATILDIAAEKFSEFSGGRYRLGLEGTGEIQVLDGWNAGEPRPVASLSGGESFGASLALALALSEYLQGRQQVQCLFIDEGFGNLDRETRDKVAEILASLQTRDKLIGIVTHIEELAEYFPSRIVVHKRPEGSFVSQNGALEQ